jgi:hypothetical protein
MVLARIPPKRPGEPMIENVQAPPQLVRPVAPMLAEQVLPPAPDADAGRYA